MVADVGRCLGPDVVDRGRRGETVHVDPGADCHLASDLERRVSGNEIDESGDRPGRRHLDRQTGLAGAARGDDRHEAAFGDECHELGELVVSAHERRSGAGHRLSDVARARHGRAIDPDQPHRRLMAAQGRLTEIGATVVGAHHLRGRTRHHRAGRRCEIGDAGHPVDRGTEPVAGARRGPPRIDGQAGGEIGRARFVGAREAGADLPGRGNRVVGIIELGEEPVARVLEDLTGVGRNGARDDLVVEPQRGLHLVG